MLYPVLGIITEHQHFATITAKYIPIHISDSSLTLTNPSTRAGKEKEEGCQVVGPARLAMRTWTEHWIGENTGELGNHADSFPEIYQGDG